MPTTAANQPSQKSCSICGVSFPLAEFNYRSRENQSYCQSCDKLDMQARSQGGIEAARKFREEMRAKWKK